MDNSAPTPLCFQSREQFDNWKEFARIAKDTASICEDCTLEYKHKMKEVNRCKQAFWTLPENKFNLRILRKI
jgi:hypothetical protein